MMNNFKLNIELVPSTIWYSSIYQYCKKNNQLEKWQKIKNDIFEKEGRKCWICSAIATRLEAHEFWEYDDRNHIQRLASIHHLCDFCHKIKHIGLWCHTSKGEIDLKKSGLTREDLINHFCRINRCSREEFIYHENEAFKVWKERSKYEWKQDFGEFDSQKRLTKFLK